MIPDSPEALPKIIWMLWLQGIDQAPDLVQKCVRSWQRHNPDWKIIVLDEHSLKSFVNLDEICHRNRRVISEQAMADIVRINLLAKCGGVWGGRHLLLLPTIGWLAARPPDQRLFCIPQSRPGSFAVQLVYGLPKKLPFDRNDLSTGQRILEPESFHVSKLLLGTENYPATRPTIKSQRVSCELVGASSVCKNLAAASILLVSLSFLSLRSHRPAQR